MDRELDIQKCLKEGLLARCSSVSPENLDERDLHVVSNIKTWLSGGAISEQCSICGEWVAFRSLYSETCPNNHLIGGSSLFC